MCGLKKKNDNNSKITHERRKPPVAKRIHIPIPSMTKMFILWRKSDFSCGPIEYYETREAALADIPTSAKENTDRWQVTLNDVNHTYWITEQELKK